MADIPLPDRDRIMPIVEALRRDFEPLAVNLPAHLEPATLFRLEAADDHSTDR
ncbi:MAG: hypothetical protein K2X35_24070 [Bryobacteraceae bacterium]|nr:hypothetical protein [Bryobacteraceae bacterium]